MEWIALILMAGAIGFGCACAGYSLGHREGYVSGLADGRWDVIKGRSPWHK